MVNLGDRVQDRISGLKGIAAAVSVFLFGCRRIGVVPEEHKDGKPAEMWWFDDAQLTVITASVIHPAVPETSKKIGPAGPRGDARRGPDAR